MKIIVFAGTGDGRELSVYLASLGADITVSVTTEYGAELLKNSGVDVRCGKLDENEMRVLIRYSDVVIDATHPYAAEASRNIINACRAEKIEYIRAVRQEVRSKNAVYVNNVAEAVEYLSETDGKIFVSTGSNELAAFESIGSRIIARVLDTEPVRRRCSGMSINEIIYKRPPFDLEENLKDMKGCSFLVTKDGGDTGGMPEKLKAAEMLSMRVVIISRPESGRVGYTFDQIKDMFRSKLSPGN